MTRHRQVMKNKSSEIMTSHAKMILSWICSSWIMIRAEKLWNVLSRFSWRCLFSWQFPTSHGIHDDNNSWCHKEIMISLTLSRNLGVQFGSIVRSFTLNHDYGQISHDRMSHDNHDFDHDLSASHDNFCESWRIFPDIHDLRHDFFISHGFFIMTIMMAVMIFQEQSHDWVMKISETLTRKKKWPSRVLRPLLFVSKIVYTICSVMFRHDFHDFPVMISGQNRDHDNDLFLIVIDIDVDKSASYGELEGNMPREWRMNDERRGC